MEEAEDNAHFPHCLFVFTLADAFSIQQRHQISAERKTISKMVVFIQTQLYKYIKSIVMGIVDALAMC